MLLVHYGLTILVVEALKNCNRDRSIKGLMIHIVYQFCWISINSFLHTFTQASAGRNSPPVPAQRSHSRQSRAQSMYEKFNPFIVKKKYIYYVNFRIRSYK